MSRYTRWCFTLNNPTDEESDQVQAAYEEAHCRYLVVGRETGETGTPHLQGFCIFKDSQRLSGCKRLLSSRAHYEHARGSNAQASDYCKKDNDFYEFGTLPLSRGKGSQWDAFRDWLRALDDRPSEEDIFGEFPGLLCQYPHGVRRGVDICFPPPAPDYETAELRPWQLELRGFLDEDADDRTIRFYVDEEGGSGKSYFTDYYEATLGNSQYLSVGRRDDLAHAIDPTKRVFFFDIPRGGMEFLQYVTLEQLKNRRIFSPKYESTTKYLHHTPHVIVFSNELPDVTKLTADRVYIKQLSQPTHNILN